LLNQSVLLSTRCTGKRAKVTNYYRKMETKNKNKKTEKEIALAYAQHRERTKPPAMIVEREVRNFRLQPHI